jgi:hypothetical protein
MNNLALNKSIEERIGNASFVTDGDIYNYNGNTGFGYFLWSGTLTIDLENVFHIKCIRILLWDGLGKGNTQRDSRIYKYRLLTSIDHKNWDVLYDTCDKGYNGWQVFNIEDGIDAKFIRLHGMWNSANSEFHVVQIEAYESYPQELQAEITLKHNVITSEISKEKGDGHPLTNKLSVIINKIEKLILENSNIINPDPFKALTSELQTQVKDIGSIENSMDSIRREITGPVKAELEKSAQVGRFSLWVGIIGGILAIIAIIISIISLIKG